MRTASLLLLTLLTLFFQACATKEVNEKPHLAYPVYPLEPKIVYIDTYTGGKAVDSTSAFDLLLGEGSSIKRSATIIKPYGVGINNGKLYVADTGASAVFVIDMKTRDLSYIGTEGMGRLSSPVSIAFDAKGTVYVSDSRDKTIKGYDKDGKYIFVHGGRMQFLHPTGIAIDKELNRLYVVDTKKHHFKAFDLATKKLIYTVGKRGKEDAEFNFPTNITVDKRNGNILVADTQNFRVQIFDKDGNFLSRFGEVGDRPGMFARPKGIAVDSEGHIYVTDAAFNNTQIFNQEGDIMLWFGTGGYTEGRFRLISGIWIDENDTIVVADAFSGRIQEFQYLSEAWKSKNQPKYKEYIDYKPEITGPQLTDGMEESNDAQKEGE